MLRSPGNSISKQKMKEGSRYLKTKPPKGLIVECPTFSNTDRVVCSVMNYLTLNRPSISDLIY